MWDFFGFRCGLLVPNSGYLPKYENKLICPTRGLQIRFKDRKQ